MPLADVIIVEGQEDLRNDIGAFLMASGFAVREVGDGAALERAWAEKSADILILDIDLPDADGLAIAERMRRSTGAGIVMLTTRGQTNDRINGFDAGADHYLVKPVVLRELIAVIKNLRARLVSRPSAGSHASTWSFDPVNWRLTTPNGMAVPLTTAEYCFLNAVLTTPGASVAFDDIIRSRGKAATNASRRSLEAVVTRLRRKVEEQSGFSLPVKSVRSVGYVFAAPLS